MRTVAAVRTVAAGDALLSPAITKRVIRQFTRIPRPAPPKELDELTAREEDILRLIAEGLSNTEIGQRLYISETTVKTHVTHILAKLGLRDRVEAVVLAYQTGLFEGRTTRQASSPASRYRRVAGPRGAVASWAATYSGLADDRRVSRAGGVHPPGGQVPPLHLAVPQPGVGRADQVEVGALPVPHLMGRPLTVGSPVSTPPCAASTPCRSGAGSASGRQRTGTGSRRRSAPG